jgi:hypothetical protein
VEFREDALDVVADGVCAQGKLASDLLIALAAGQEREDLEFAFGQSERIEGAVAWLGVVRGMWVSRIRSSSFPATWGESTHSPAAVALMAPTRARCPSGLTRGAV